MNTPWIPFFFESNQFFDTIKDMSGWQKLREAYPHMTDDELLDAKEATYGGTLGQHERDENPKYGFRWECDGERTLRDFFDAHGMSLSDAP